MKTVREAVPRDRHRAYLCMDRGTYRQRKRDRGSRQQPAVSDVILHGVLDASFLSLQTYQPSRDWFAMHEIAGAQVPTRPYSSPCHDADNKCRCIHLPCMPFSMSRSSQERPTITVDATIALSFCAAHVKVSQAKMRIISLDMIPSPSFKYLLFEAATLIEWTSTTPMLHTSH